MADANTTNKSVYEVKLSAHGFDVHDRTIGGGIVFTSNSRPVATVVAEALASGRVTRAQVARWPALSLADVTKRLHAQPQTDSSRTLPGPPRRYRARFQAEAWINDNAVPVDPEGSTEWDCTAFVDESKLAYLVRLSECENASLDDPVDGVLDDEAVFKDDPAAPRWVRDWRGPFTIRIFSDSPA